MFALRPYTLHVMCRNIRTLYNYDPPATEEEVRAAALQYVRKISGFNKPSRANEEAFARAVDAVALASSQLLDELRTTAPAKNRETEAAEDAADAVVGVEVSVGESAPVVVHEQRVRAAELARGVVARPERDGALEL